MKIYVSWGVVGIGMFTKASNFWGSITFPSLYTRIPRMVPENTINAHFYGFKLIPNSLHLRKHFVSFSRGVDRSLKNYKFIKKYLHEYINVLMKYFGYYHLIKGRSIFYTKWHHNPHNSPLVCHKGGSMIVLWCNQYMMISWKLVEKGTLHAQQMC